MTKKIDDGVIKFSYKLNFGTQNHQTDYLEIEKWRVIFYRMNFIGEYREAKIGFGNLSKRIASPKDSFLITGSQTGAMANLKLEHYCHVTDSNLEKNSVVAKGSIPPSSESLTHYAIYHSCPHINYVFHIHHEEFWNALIEEGTDSTPNHISYGTLEMAQEASKLIGNKQSGLFVMKGHQDGVVAYGTTAEETGKTLLDRFKKIVI
jgi:hypothetical protein